MVFVWSSSCLLSSRSMVILLLDYFCTRPSELSTFRSRSLVQLISQGLFWLLHTPSSFLQRLIPSNSTSINLSYDVSLQWYCCSFVSSLVIFIFMIINFWFLLFSTWDVQQCLLDFNNPDAMEWLLFFSFFYRWIISCIHFFQFLHIYIFLESHIPFQKFPI